MDYEYFKGRFEAYHRFMTGTKTTGVDLLNARKEWEKELDGLRAQYPEFILRLEKDMRKRIEGSCKEDER